MSGEKQENWLIKEFERAKKRSESLPEWARPVVIAPVRKNLSEDEPE